MPRKTDRNFVADFETLGIEYLPTKGPEVSDDIQMVYQMGNVAGVPAFTTAVHLGAGAFEGAVVGAHAILQIECRNPGGLVVEAASVQVTDASLARVLCWTRAAGEAITGPATINLTDANSGIHTGPAAPLSVLISGTVPNAALPFFAYRWVSNELGLGGVFVGNGGFLMLVNGSQNLNSNMAIRWRELLRA